MVSKYSNCLVSIQKMQSNIFISCGPVSVHLCLPVVGVPVARYVGLSEFICRKQQPAAAETRMVRFLRLVHLKVLISEFDPLRPITFVKSRTTAQFS